MAVWQATSLGSDVILFRWTPDAGERMIALSSTGDESRHANDPNVAKPQDDALGELSGQCRHPTRTPALRICAIRWHPAVGATDVRHCVRASCPKRPCGDSLRHVRSRRLQRRRPG